jgi:4-hydroxy-tetrahydrodipicolinate synthase
MNHKLQGLFPPVVLPLDAKGQLDFDSLGRQVDFLLAGGADGIWLNGTTGDFFALTAEESAQIVAAAAQRVARRVPVIAQVGQASTRQTIDWAERALEAGADHLAVVLPYYVEYTADELKEHFRVIQRATGQALVVYQIPQMCKVSLSQASLIELARDGVIFAVKESSGNMDAFRQLSAKLREEGLAVSCLNGSSALMDVSLSVGGQGLVCTVANLVPHLCQDLYRHAAAKDPAGATALQEQVSELLRTMRLPGRPNFAATIAVYKWLLRQLGLFHTDKVFAPLAPLTKSEEHYLREGALPLAQQLAGELLARGAAEPEAAGAQGPG